MAKKKDDEEVMWAWFARATPDERYRRAVAFRNLVSFSGRSAGKTSAASSRAWSRPSSKASRRARSTRISG